MRGLYGGTAFAALGAALAAKSAALENRIFGYENISRYLRQQKRSFSSAGSIATGNRHGGAHEHKREIARRLRQQGVAQSA